MKKLLPIFIILGLGVFSFTQLFSQSVPQGMNYQAIARDVNGVELASKTLTIKLAIKSKSGSTYTTQYEETHSVTTNAYGLFTLVIGQGTVTTGTFSSIPWSTYEMYLNVSVNDGNGYVDLGKTQLVSVPYAFVAGSVTSGSSGSGWLLTGNTGTSTSSDFIGTTDNVDLLFKTDNNEVMRLQSDGNVSIGGTSSQAKLYVDADSADDPLRIKVEGLTKFIIESDGNVGVGTFSPAGLFHVSSIEDFVVLDNGNVGIGTTTPAAALNVTSGNVAIGTNSSYATLHVNAESGDDALRVQVNGSTKLWVLSNGATSIGAAETDVPDNGAYVNGQLLVGLDDQSSYYADNMKMIAYVNNNTSGTVYGLRGRITGNSIYDENIAIAGYATGDGFHYGVKGVAGNATGAAYGVYGEANGWVAAVYANGDMEYTGNLSGPSDSKLKKDILPMTNVLDKVIKLEPKTYEFKTDEYSFMNLPKGKQFGLISQELEQIFPELIEESMHPGPEDEKGNHKTPISYKGVKYIELVPILIQAMKEQQEMINAQNEKINALEQKINEQNNNKPY